MKLRYPTSQKDITLSQYVSYLNMIKDLDENQNNTEFVNIKMLEIFCNIDFETAMNIMYVDVLQIVETIKNVINEKPDIQDNLFFKVGDLEFGFVTNIDKLKYGAFLDLNANIGSWDTMHISMGVLYTPVLKKNRKGLYLVEEYKGDIYHDAIKEMPLSCVTAAMVFFWNLGIDLTTYMSRYLEMEATKMNLTQQLSLVESGVGIQQLTNSLEVILQDMKQ
jgi:hypothetical protein